jgi:hypothetical protein
VKHFFNGDQSSSETSVLSLASNICHDWDKSKISYSQQVPNIFGRFLGERHMARDQTSVPAILVPGYRWAHSQGFP